MPINVAALNAAIATLGNAINVARTALGTPTSTSADFSALAAAISATASSVQATLTAGGLDSDLVAQQQALHQAIAAGCETLLAAQKAIAVATPGSTWPPNAGPNATGFVWRN